MENDTLEDYQSKKKNSNAISKFHFSRWSTFSQCAAAAYAATSLVAGRLLHWMLLPDSPRYGQDADSIQRLLGTRGKTAEVRQ